MGAVISAYSVHPAPTRTKVLMSAEPVRSAQLEMARKVPTQFLQRWRQRQPSWESMCATQVKKAPGRQYQQVALIWASITVAVTLRLTGLLARGQKRAEGPVGCPAGRGVLTRVPARVRWARARRTSNAASFILLINLYKFGEAIADKIQKSSQKIIFLFLNLINLLLEEGGSILGA